MMDVLTFSRRGLDRGWLRGHLGQRVRVRLLDGYEVSGTLLGHDRAWLRVQPDDGGEPVLIRRRAVAVAQACCEEGALHPVPPAVNGAARAVVESGVDAEADPLVALGRWVVRCFRERTALSLFVLALGVYAISNHGREQIYNQYVWLADAFLHGRLEIVGAPPWLELARWEGRAYVVYPPLPAVLLMPFVLVFGREFEQAILSIGMGALSVPLCYLAVLRLFGRRAVAVWTAVLFGFGTVFWYHAENGSVWATEHIVASFFLWLALLEAATRRRLLLIGLAIGCAYLSRLPTIMAAFFFVIYLWRDFLPDRWPPGRGEWRRLFDSYLDLSIGIIGAIVVNAAYNYARFGEVTNAGYTLLDGFSNMWWFTYGLLDVRYIEQHLEEMLLRGPSMRSEWPFVAPDIYAMALWVTTPAFAIAAFARWRSPIAIGAAVATVLTAIPILMHGASGFAQFGYRYTLDFTPFLLLLTASAMTRGIRWWMKALIGVSVLTNLWGVLMLSFFEIYSFG